MKKNLITSIAIVLVLSVVIVAVVSADLTYTWTDGYWMWIDDGYDGVKIDVVGVVGSDPGTEWGSGNKTTQGDTLIRNATVCTQDGDGDATLSEWTGISPAVYTNLGSHTYGPGACDYQGFFISEYIEGATDAIELFNNYGQDIDFSAGNFWIHVYDAGNLGIRERPDEIIQLSGSIANGSTYVIASSDITGVTENLIDSDLDYSGDDAVVLVRAYEADAGYTDDATSSNYSGGPTGDNPTTGSPTVLGNPSSQFAVTNDWNQVRYGNPAFASQSGLAFKGIQSNTDEFAEEDPVLIGKFCHVNNPIFASNSFNYCPLTIDVHNISCGDPASTVPPYPAPKLSFMFPITLDETTNSGSVEDCPYPTEADNPCSDAVTLLQSSTRFNCYYLGDVVKTYTVSIIGFMPLDSPDSTCDEMVFDPEDARGIFISNEGATNCGCLYAMITDAEITAVELLSFSGESTDDGVLITWETASETENLGFNLYRADSLIGERVQLNDTLIPTKVPPGSPFGGSYEFLDATATEYQTYFYWLEDVDASGETTLHGPISVNRD